MKIKIILGIFLLTCNLSYSAENKDCSIYNKLSKEYLSCKSINVNKTLNIKVNNFKSKSANSIKEASNNLKESGNKLKEKISK